MKKVLLEMERLRNPYSGLGQFCLNFGKEITSAATQKDLDFTFYVPDNQRFIFGNEAFYLSVSKWHKLFPIAGNFDIWHCLHQGSNYLPNNKKTKLILTIHDLNFLERDDYSNARKELKMKELQKKINRSSALTYISNFTKNTIHEHLKIPENIIEKVIYNGNNILDFQPLEIPNQAPVGIAQNTQFVFSIGIIQPKKNFHVLLPILQKNNNLVWLIAGDNSSDYTKVIKQKAQEIGVNNQVQFLGKVQDSEKLWLFKNCTAFLFPSLAEGFGMPVIEAMSFGKPVFLSKLTSLPEIGGSEAYYFNDFTPETIIKTFEDGMTDFQNEKYKVERIKTNAMRFSWQNAAREYIDLYHQL